MTDERMTDLLRMVDRADEPSSGFLDRLYGELTVELGFRAPVVPSPARVRRSTRWWVLLAALLALTLAGSAVIAGAVVRTLQPEASVLDAIRSAGVVQVLVRDGYPQATSSQGRGNGFDTDVVRELARRLGVAADTVAIADGLTVDDLDLPIERGRVVSMTSSLRGHDPEREARSVPIYFWPIAVVVAADSAFASVDELDGAAICVVQGTTGEAWLSGLADRPGITDIQRPPDATTVTRPNDESCLDALADGTVAAAVTADLGPADLAVRGMIRALPGAAIIEERYLIVDRDAGDVRSLLAEIDAAIEAARADGTLADLARSRFGGYDLSAPPSASPQEE